MRLSDTIERFIKAMLEEDVHEVELKRNELATYFGCAPSQINYVLATRFSPDHGYITESRRGGGGYIRIVRVTREEPQQLHYVVSERVGDALSEAEAVRLLSQLAERGMITPAEAELIRAAVSAQALGIPIPEQIKNAIRARTMKTMLLTIARQNKKEGKTHG